MAWNLNVFLSSSQYDKSKKETVKSQFLYLTMLHALNARTMHTAKNQKTKRKYKMPSRQIFSLSEYSNERKASFYPKVLTMEPQKDSLFYRDADQHPWKTSAFWHICFYSNSLRKTKTIWPSFGTDGICLPLEKHSDYHCNRKYCTSVSRKMTIPTEDAANSNSSNSTNVEKNVIVKLAVKVCAIC